MNRHARAKELYAEGNYPAAIEIINELLDENPNDPAAIFLMGGIMIQTNKRGLAYNLYARCAKLAPERPEVWTNYGRCQDDTPEGWEVSEWCFNKALELNPNALAAITNMGALEIQRCRPEEALKWCDRALKLQPDDKVALSTLGFAGLMMGNWEDGWKYYDAMLGHRSRPDIQYGDLPIWDGKGGTVIVNGEQGIGDELIYSQALVDMAKDCEYVIYDCMPRLKRLMKRSLPGNVYVAGGRWEDEIILPAAMNPTARCTQAAVLKYYRNSDDDFTGEPYLVADPSMRISIRALLDSLGDKPKIGIAWTGGTKNSRQHFRQRTLEELTPLLRNNDVTWVSLQYKDPSKEIAEYKEKRGIHIHHFPWITEEKEYDYTAALVAELDLVIAVPTSATQLAGGLGTECWVMVPEITGWLFNRDKYVWANSVTLFRNKKPSVINDQLKKWLLTHTQRSRQQLATG